MANDSTSDKLKQIFAQNGGGKEKDWKRTDKRKDGQGRWVRTFENAVIGAGVEVTEVGKDKYETRSLKAGDSTAADSAGKKLAAKYVFAIKKDDDEGMTEHGGYYAIISPKAYFEKTGYCYDQASPIDKLMPDAEDVNDCGTWVFEKAKPDAKALADDLSARGFIHDPKFQKFIAPEVARELAATPKAQAPKKQR